MGNVTVIFTDGTTETVHVSGKGDFVVVENDQRTPERIILEQMGITHYANASSSTPITYPDDSQGQFYKVTPKKVTADSISVDRIVIWYWWQLNGTM
jgi:hypothetical protein